MRQYMLSDLTYRQSMSKKVKKFNIPDMSPSSTFSFNVYKLRTFFDTLYLKSSTF
jgi:hypothetical protein